MTFVPTWTLAAGSLDCRRRGLRVEQAEGNCGDADVAGVRRVQKTRAEDPHRGRQRGVLGGQVQRRECDQVPESGNRVLGLAVLPEPVGKGLLVE